MDATAAERKHARRFLLRYLLPFLLLIVAFCFGWDFFLRETVIYETEIQGVAKLNRVFAPHPGEIPIVGSSRALGSYIPDSIHPNAYNYGINGIGYPVMDLILRKILSFQDEKTPIILNWDYEMFMKAIGDPNNYIALSHKPEIRALLKKAEIYDILQEANGLRFFGDFDLYMREYLNQRMQLTKWITKGASIEKDPVTVEEIEKLIRERAHKPALWQPYKWMVDSLLQRISSRPDREWIIVVSPYHDSYYASFPKKDFAQARSVLAYLDRLSNARVLDISGRGWPDSLFVNTSHINLKGAIRFSNEVGAALRDSIPAFVE